METKIEAVAFDIDGTLYADWRLYIQLVPYFVSNFRFFLFYSGVRKELHRTAVLPDFYEYQARLMARKLGVTSKEARALIQAKVYDGFKDCFTRIKPFPYAIRAAMAFKEAGLKVAILSDFPPKQKGEIWGLKGICDAIISSEESGALKPCIYPFATLAIALGLPCEKILYVGNSVRCDVMGAKNAGMKVAFKMGLLRSVLGLKPRGADFCFMDYRRLKDYVLGSREETTMYR